MFIHGVGLDNEMWDKQLDIQTALESMKDLLRETQTNADRPLSPSITRNIAIYDAYIFYCKYYANTTEKSRLIVSKAYFEKYPTPFELVVAQQDICCNTQSKLHELLNCNLQGFARSIYLESIVLYLLYQVQKNNLVFQLNCDTCSFVNKPLELEKIQKAKEFILVNLDQSITIPALANYVGTNQCYLKKGFKEVFGQTIYEFVQENKMVKAKYLLQQNKLSLQEISAIVGYASLSSFSQTYKNYYGISPSIEKKQISNS